MGSQRRGELDYANLNRLRVVTEPGNSVAARPVLGDGEGSLGDASTPRTCADASLISLLASRLLRTVAENSNLVAT
jgi:hypothetical protein